MNGKYNISEKFLNININSHKYVTENLMMKIFNRKLYLHEHM